MLLFAFTAAVSITLATNSFQLLYYIDEVLLSACMATYVLNVVYETVTVSR